VTEPFVPPGRASGPHAATPRSSVAFHQRTYRFTTGLRAGEVAVIRGESAQVVLSYRAFAGVTGVVASLVTAIVALAGMAGVAFLLAEGAVVRAVAAAALTFAFAYCISLLVPRVDVTLYEENTPALTISQRSVAPASSWVVITVNGTELAEIRKSFLSRLGRNRWRILQHGRPVGDAVEESFGRALVRKVLGKFDRRFETNLLVRNGDLPTARIIRRPEGNGQYDLLEITGDLLDTRVVVALATLVLGREP
jgi:hypothetical protein